ncbi:MAG: ABC transporter ATP-binding protein [Lentisphaerota bacterium]
MSYDNNDIVLSVKNVSKCYEMYGKPSHRLWQTLSMGRKTFYKEFWALRDINFEVKKGECVGIIGRNGAGKSTLLQIITGTLQPTAGSVEVKGRVAALLELGSGFNPEFTGRENVYMNASILGLTKAEIDARFDEIVAFADIGDFIEQPVKTYSSGMMVRLAFAVQVVVEPDILIVDEALAVGDALFQRKCYARMEQLIEKGMTLILVTHDTDTVKRICKRTIFLKSGQQAFDGNAREGVLEYFRYLFPVENNTVSQREKPEIEQAVIGNKDEYIYRTDVTNQKKEWGVGGGRIIEINIYGLEPPNILKSPCTITIEVLAEWNIDFVREYILKENIFPNINVGIQISDARNIILYGTNTFLENIMIDPFNQSSANAYFELKLPQLFSGDIFVSAAIVIGNMNQCVNMHFPELASIIRNEVQQVKAGLIYFDTIARVEVSQ